MHAFNVSVVILNFFDDRSRTSVSNSCAFAKTPKFNQVEKSGRGTIVNQQWILDCYEQNQRLPEKNYRFNEGKPKRLSDDEDNDRTGSRKTPQRRSTATFDDDDDEEEEEQRAPRRTRSSTRPTEQKKPIATFDDDDDDEEEESEEKSVSKKPSTHHRMSESDEDTDGEWRRKSSTTRNDRGISLVYQAETDDEETTVPEKLSDFFREKYFYVFDDEFDPETFHDIRRVIYAYDGTLEKKMTNKIDFIITNQTWNEKFDEVGTNSS